MIWSPSFELPTLKPAPSAQYMLGCGSCRACSFSDHITARHPFASKLTSVCTRSDGENSRLPTHTAPHLEGRGAPNIPGRHARALSAPCTSHQHTRPEGGGPGLQTQPPTGTQRPPSRTDGRGAQGSSLTHRAATCRPPEAPTAHQERNGTNVSSLTHYQNGPKHAHPKKTPSTLTETGLPSQEKRLRFHTMGTSS